MICIGLPVVIGESGKYNVMMYAQRMTTFPATRANDCEPVQFTHTTMFVVFAVTASSAGLSNELPSKESCKEVSNRRIETVQLTVHIRTDIPMWCLDPKPE
jgi:hypothetical protein